MTFLILGWFMVLGCFFVYGVFRLLVAPLFWFVLGVWGMGGSVIVTVFSLLCQQWEWVGWGALGTVTGLWLALMVIIFCRANGIELNGDRRAPGHRTLWTEFREALTDERF